MRARLLAFAVAPLLALGVVAKADEGMWTFDNFPAAAVQKKYGVDVSAAWLDRVRGAAVRLASGCSASVVSPEGLVLTNHHCVRDCVQALSTAAVNHVEDGFIPAGRSDEKACPGAQAEILARISDVTTRVTAAAAGRTGQEFVRARDGEIATIEKAGCAGREATHRCQVISLYQGGQYRLYEYRRYADVRLAFAPEAQAAFFGGDPDNFNFPRYDLDFALLRLYENGKPAVTPVHLSWRSSAPKDGEPVFVAGNPGTTQRLLTAEQLEALRDKALPTTLVFLSELRGRLTRFSAESAENRRVAEDTLFGAENSFKAFTGQQKALVDPTLITAKRKFDAELKAAVAKDAKLAAEIGDPWSEIAAAQVHYRANYDLYTMTESRAGYRSELFAYARSIVRAAQERAKPNAERLTGYTDSQLPLLERQVLDVSPVYPALEQEALSFWLSKLREYLTADAPQVRSFLGKDSPETLAARLSKSSLADPALRRKLWEGGLTAVTASDDPMIRFVLATDAVSRETRKVWEDRVTGPVDRAAQRIARARFAVYGDSTYPDATFSLRLSYGQVAGWAKADGTKVEPFTRYAGLWERATGQFPFNLPKRWENGQSRIQQDVVFNFTSDNDIIGGNSGSPVIDATGAVVGLVFDGNIDSLGGSFGFDPAVNRTVSVATSGITEALRGMYGQTALLKELGG
jgi:hypothetical protein